MNDTFCDSSEHGFIEKYISGSIHRRPISYVAAVHFYIWYHNTGENLYARCAEHDLQVTVIYEGLHRISCEEYMVAQIMGC